LQNNVNLEIVFSEAAKITADETYDFIWETWSEAESCTAKWA